MIVGIASGLTATQLRPWAASARKVWDGDILLLTDTRPSYRDLQTAYDVEVREVTLRTGAGICDISRTRWLALAEALPPTSEPIVFVDTRDAVFQSNPLTRISDKLVIGSEGKRHEENDWCLHWLNRLSPDSVPALRATDVLCAGAIGAPATLLRELAVALYHQLPRFACDCTWGAQHMGDQALLNVLLRNGFAPDVEITTDWCFHVRSMDHARIPAVYDETTKRLLREDGEPFPIVHQWDLASQLSHFSEIR